MNIDSADNTSLIDFDFKVTHRASAYPEFLSSCLTMRCKSGRDRNGGEETRETAPETEGADIVIFIALYRAGIQGSLLKVITTGRASIKEERERERMKERESIESPGHTGPLSG